MRMVKPLVVLAASLLLAALLASCVSTVRFQRMMDGYVGQHIDQVRAVFGYNYIVRDLPNNHRAFTWTWVERGVIPGYQSPTTIETYSADKGQRITILPGTYFPPEYYEAVCEFSFIVSPPGQVVSWRAQGNGCATYYGPGPILGPALKR